MSAYIPLIPSVTVPSAQTGSKVLTPKSSLEAIRDFLSRSQRIALSYKRPACDVECGVGPTKSTIQSWKGLAILPGRGRGS
jgi:hypothetical protein